jgi:HSP20 family protein
MAVIRWNPWNLSSFLNEDEWEMPTVPGLSRLAGQGLNLYETEKSLVAEVALPGVEEDKIDISVDKGIVRISARREQVTEDKDERKYYMSSMASTYNYSFRLPEGMADQEPEAVLENGILTLRFAKPAVVPPKKIKVNVKGSAKKVDSTKNP